VEPRSRSELTRREFVAGAGQFPGMSRMRLTVVAAVLASGTACKDEAPAASTATAACMDETLGVCKVADAGIRHITLSRAGANGLAVDSVSGRVYVVINGATSPWCGDVGNLTPGLSIVDPVAGKELLIAPTAEGPVWPLVDTKRGKVYVAGSGGIGTVAVQHPATGVIEKSILLGGRPHDLGLDPAGSLLLVSNTFDKTQTWISLVNLDSGVVAANIQVPDLPHKVVVDNMARIGYVVSLGAGQITEVDLKTGAKLREISSGPIPQTSAMVYSPLRKRLYVAKTAGSTPSNGNTVVAVDVATGNVVATAGTFTPASSVPTRAWGGFGLDDANGLLYAAMANSNMVAVVDVATMKPAAVFNVDACPWAVALDVPRGVGYVSSNQSAALTMFDLRKVMQAIGR